MKRILFSIGSLEGGGAEKVLLDVANHLCERYDVTVQTIYNAGLYREQLDPRIHYRSIVKKPSLNKMRVYHRLITYFPPQWTYRWFVGKGYDISVAFLEGISSKLISGAGNSSHTISWIHTDIRSINPKHAGYWHHADQSRCYRRFDQIVCVSHDAKEAFMQTVDGAVEPQVIFNPIDSEAILRKAKQPLGIPEKDYFTFCSVGRLVPVKAFDRVIRAIALLNEEGLPCQFWLVGEGAERTNLEKLASDLHVADQVVFLGFQTNPYPILAACDAYVCSSLQEGYPLSVAEALVLGRPVIATHCTGPREMLKDGEYGMLTENSPEGVYAGMKAILEDGNVRSDMVAKAAASSETFDFSVAFNKIVRLIEGM